MGHGHGHEISASGKNKKQLKIVLALTTTYLIAEVVGGFLTNSLALLADAGHMLTDVGGLALALLAIKFAERPATPEKTYGYYRVEILAALTNAVVLIGISIYILYEAYERFRNPPEVQSRIMLVIASIGLAINIVGVFILRAGSQESLNMKGAYFEVLSDMLTSVGVIIAGIIMLTTGWYYADPIISAGIGLFIFPRTWALLKDAVGVLLAKMTVKKMNYPLRKGFGSCLCINLKQVQKFGLLLKLTDLLQLYFCRKNINLRNAIKVFQLKCHRKFQRKFVDQLNLAQTLILNAPAYNPVQ